MVLVGKEEEEEEEEEGKASTMLVSMVLVGKASTVSKLVLFGQGL